MAAEIKVPTLGESIAEATVAKWIKNIGDSVTQDEPVVELETDKATLEVPAPASGIITSISAEVGDNVEVGGLLAMLEDEGKAAMPAKTPEKTAKKQASASGDSSGDISVSVPTLGESVAEATIAKWMKNIGDSVAVDEPMALLETDKATLEVPAPVAGILKSINAASGENVEVGAVIAVIGQGETMAAEVMPTPAETAPMAAPKKSAKEGPAAKRLIAENNLDTSQMSGSGKDGRLTKGDVLTAINQPTKTPKPANRKSDTREERVPMTKLRKVIARRLKEAQNNAAMLTTFNEVDMSGVMELRSEYRDIFEKKHGVKIGFMSFFVHATIAALKEFPAVNAEIHGDDIIYKNFYNIGVAVGTPQGLVVPVLKDADTMSFAETEAAINDYAIKAKSGKLAMDDMAGGTFSISNGGVYGSMLSTPILNPPQSGILGMHNIQKRAVVVSTDKGDEIQIKPMMYLALSYDHRIIDGREAVSFLSRIKNIIEDPRRLILGL